MDRIAPSRSATPLATRQRLRPDAAIVFGGVVSAWRCSTILRDKSLAYRDSWNIGCELPADYSALAPENFTTLAHFSVSSAMNFPKSAGEPEMAVAPNSEIRALILGSARAALISLLSLSTISGGVFLGAPTPIQGLISKPGTNSRMVGTSGKTWDRSAAVIAKGRTLPSLTNSIEVVILSNMTCTCPPIKSESAGAWPRYGT